MADSDLKHYTIGGDTSRTYQLSADDAEAFEAKQAQGAAHPDKDGNPPANKGGKAPTNKGTGTSAAGTQGGASDQDAS